MTIDSRNIPRNISILVVAIIVIGYTIFNFRIFVAGPQIVFKSPTNGSAQEKSLVEIEGLAKNISHITLNDRQIFINQSGEFNETVLLYPGYNVFTVKARDKFNRETENKLEIVYNGQEIKPNTEVAFSSFGESEEDEENGGEQDDQGDRENSAEILVENDNIEDEDIQN
jgi:hypothetical protein